MGEIRNGVRKVHKRIFEIMVVQRLDSTLPMQGSQVGSMIRKLRLPMPCGNARKKRPSNFAFVIISQILLGGHFMIMLNNLCK